MRLGFFGGSFDPPHRGHLAVARAAARRFALGEVIFAPVGRQPLKEAGARASFTDRMEMVQLLCKAGEEGWPESAPTLNRARLTVTDLDGPLSGGGANYTVDALASLAERRPDAELFSLVGADSFLDLRRWRQPERLLTLAEWIVVSRPGVSMDEAALAPLGLDAAERARVHLLADVHEPISATELRQRLAVGEDCGAWLPPAVERYIRDRHLYTTARQ